MNARVLIVEDNAANLELMSYLLQAAGHTVIRGCDGEEGLKAAHEASPDLILCDVRMPKVDGYELARQIKSTAGLRNIPLVAVSAFQMRADRRKALSAGFDAYLTKPIEPATFVDQVQAFLPPELRCASTTDPTPTSESPQKRGSLGCTILVVDVVQAQLDFCSSVLEPFGYAVVQTNSAQSALDVARLAPPNLIISDVRIADGSAYDLIRECRRDAALASVPFLFVTSTMASEKERQKGLALGAAKFLFRPIEPEQLLAGVASCVLASPKSSCLWRQVR